MTLNTLEGQQLPICERARKWDRETDCGHQINELADLVEKLVEALDGLLACASHRRPDGHYEFCLVPSRDVEAARDAAAEVRGQQ